MNLAMAAVPSPLRTDDSGVIRVGSYRIMLERLVDAFDGGASAGEIVASHPTLEPGRFYTTIACVLKNRGEVDAYMAGSEAEAERVHQEWEAGYPRRTSGAASVNEPPRPDQPASCSW